MAHKEDRIAYHAMTVSDVLRSLGVRLDGLRDIDVRASRSLHGANVIRRPVQTGPLRIMLRQVTGPLMLVLFAALVASMFLRDHQDALLIGIVIVLQGILGFAQEYRADRAFAALARYLPDVARVRREGKAVAIPAQDVVVGDILLLRLGDRVVADGRVISAVACEVNEASLTGESQPVAKHNEPLPADTVLADRANMVFAGTTIAAGTAEVVVTAVDEQTAFGAIAAMAAHPAVEKTPLQQQLERFSRKLVIVILSAVALVFLWGLSKGMSVLDLLPLSLALAVAAVPEGLLVALTVILARGMQRMAQRKALVRNLLAAETLGSVNVICTDKTGTLTMGRMVVTEVRPVDNDARALWRALALANVVSKEVRDGHEITTGTQTELAVHALLRERGVERPPHTRALGTVPFDSRYKFSASSFAVDNRRVLVAMGAPDVLLERVDCTDGERGLFAATIEQLSRRGLRVLMAVERDYDVPDVIDVGEVRDMRVVGFLGMEDPVRPQATAMVEASRRAGIRTIMLTGDHPGTAQAVAQALGLTAHYGAIMTGVEIARLDDVSLRSRVAEISVFARIRPEDKLRIVHALQANGATVAMTGDGVNDAPALRAADIGIAVGSGTDVAKEAADVVLLDDDFGTIVEAIREGRGVYDNARKVVTYLLIGSFTQLVLALAAIALGLPLPLAPLHILWINLLTDGLPALALAGEEPERAVMREAPRHRSSPLLTRGLLGVVIAGAVITNTVLVGMLVMLHAQGVPQIAIQSMLFLTLGMTSTLFIFSIRSLRRTLPFVNPISNLALVFAVILSIGLLLAPFLVPSLESRFGVTGAVLQYLPFIVLLAVVKMLVIESVKVLFSRGILEPVWTSPAQNTFKTRSSP